MANTVIIVSSAAPDPGARTEPMWNVTANTTAADPTASSDKGAWASATARRANPRPDEAFMWRTATIAPARQLPAQTLSSASNSTFFCPNFGLSGPGESLAKLHHTHKRII